MNFHVVDKFFDIRRGRYDVYIEVHFKNGGCQREHFIYFDWDAVTEEISHILIDLPDLSIHIKDDYFFLFKEKVTSLTGSMNIDQLTVNIGGICTGSYRPQGFRIFQDGTYCRQYYSFEGIRPQTYRMIVKR